MSFVCRQGGGFGLAFPTRRLLFVTDCATLITVNGKRKASPKTSGKAPTMDIKAFWAENHLGFTTRNGCEIFCTSHIFKDREKMQLLKQHGDELMAYARSVVGDDCTEWTEKGRRTRLPPRRGEHRGRTDRRLLLRKRRARILRRDGRRSGQGLRSRPRMGPHRRVALKRPNRNRESRRTRHDLF